MAANINTSHILGIDVISQLHMKLEFEPAVPKRSVLASQVKDPVTFFCPYLILKNITESYYKLFPTLLIFLIILSY